MNASLWLAAVVLMAFVVPAVGAWLVGRRTPRWRRRRSTYVKASLLVFCGILLAVFAFWSDIDLRETTLYEVVLEGSPEQADVATIRRVDFQIEHPGVEHDLLIGPMYRPPSLQWPDFNVQIGLTLGRHGEPPLIDETFDFKPRHQENKWRPEYLHFIPRAEGRYTLSLTLLTPGIPAVHVRVGDPLKRDGKRAPGY